MIKFYDEIMYYYSVAPNSERISKTKATTLNNNKNVYCFVAEARRWWCDGASWLLMLYIIVWICVFDVASLPDIYKPM